MEQDASLLELVKKKELELKEKESKAKREADELLTRTRAEADVLVQTARQEGKVQAEEYYSKEIALLDAEKERIRHEASDRREATQVKGRGRIREAIRTITERVAFS
ncbi:MAG: hypothetical protein ACP5NU_00060 [Methanomicrobiales archaeon]|jgi:vacuolar-type H+-ATPase subunit H|nr:hypothetical protein [Burkholderiaceae bacterium]NLH26052.1 hypothetical protein [Methanomicrobiales archaeon]HNB02923.1 V-type ATPase subunit subunit G family protein [Methanoregulaceae archaeon]HNI42660.1 V-type ATPase subunit subunit G family protein [Methanoregulaceae archaeon]HNJ80461.1 V-type ATPase subunit subunit G family protein [Methanoregulaceae archaeon]